MQEITNFNLEKTTTEILMLKDKTVQRFIQIGKEFSNTTSLSHSSFKKILQIY